MKFAAFIFVCLSAMICRGQYAQKVTDAVRQAVGGRWQSTDGDTYEFESANQGTNGTYLHYQVIPPVSKAALAEDVDHEKRIRLADGHFFAEGNFLILLSRDGTAQTNQFLVGKNDVKTEGKFFDSGYTLTLTLKAGKVRQYNLVYW